MTKSLTAVARSGLTIAVVFTAVILLVFRAKASGASGVESAAETAVCLVVLAAVIWFFLTRPITSALGVLTVDANRLAAGDLDFVVDVSDRSETGRAMAALAGVQSSVAQLATELNHVSAEHDAGDIDVRMPTDRFTGAYATVATGVNLMVGGHIEVKKKAMAVVKAFGEGDFDVPMEQLPGKKAFINDTIEQVRANLKSLVKEINHMSAEHDAGDIDVLIPAEKFHGGYRTMAQGVNDMVANHIGVKKKAMAVFKAFGEGDFDAPMEQLPGKKAFINDTIEQVRANLKRLIEEMNHMAAEHSRGDIDVRADASRHQGDFKAIVDGVNHTLDAIVDPLIQITEVLTAMADGDLTRALTTTYAGRLENLRLAVNNTIVKLAETVGTVIDSADQLNSASSQISGASQAMSQAATEQAASVEETTASIEQMGVGITQNSENATLTEGIATKAATDAAEGGAAVQQTVDAMKQIAGKITIIDDIAFQTNMLALNATIEAARAGEHGKGFAVVATEVGKLAERSQIAAQEISQLAAGSVNTAERAGALLREIVPSITKTSDLVQEIAAASSEQSSGVRQIDTAMSQVSKITQQNASSSEELAATAEQMSAQTAQLQTVMAFFTTASTAARRAGNGRTSQGGNGSPGKATKANSAATWPTQVVPGAGKPRRGEVSVPDIDDSKFDRF